jgi:hypothetical protein
MGTYCSSIKFVTYPGNSKENKKIAWRALGTVNSKTTTKTIGNINVVKMVRRVLVGVFPFPAISEGIVAVIWVRLEK